LACRPAIGGILQACVSPRQAHLPVGACR
jgi:hypothetical protein